MLPIPIPGLLFKISTIALGAACIFLGIVAFTYKTMNSSLMKENGELVTEIASVRGSIELQNKAIEELEAKTKAYKNKLKDAQSKNEESQRELERSLEEIRTLRLPKECDGKIDVLKEELIKAAKGWRE